MPNFRRLKRVNICRNLPLSSPRPYFLAQICCKFLKEEALKQFDCDYDILYQAVKDEMVGNESFRDILLFFSDEKTLSEIERNNPMLTIRIPSIFMFNVHPSTIDVLDNELPVALSYENGSRLYMNGEVVDTIKKGDIPGFNLLVVTQNTRVESVVASRNGRPHIVFKNPCYDGSKYAASGSRTATVDASVPGPKALDAFYYFYADDSSVHSRALQRDYIYYGITSDNNNGSLNRSVSEYMNFIEVDPKAYFKITDSYLGDNSDDPEIVKEKVTRKKRDFTEEELIERFWSGGSYDFIIKVITSDNSWPMDFHLLLKPEEIWNFNLHRTHRNATKIRHSRYTYHIDPADFTAKRCFIPKEKRLSFGKWDLSQEATTRYVSFSEGDTGATLTETYSYEMIRTSTKKVSGGVKYGLGLEDINANGEINVEGTDSNTRRETKQFTITRTDGDDQLGHVRIYFYDPIIESRNGSQYNVRTYTTGIVTFGLSAE